MQTIDIISLQVQIKKVIGASWMLSPDSSLPMPDPDGIISCNLIIRNRKDPSLEFNSAFAINTRSALSIESQIGIKLRRMKKSGIGKAE